MAAEATSNYETFEPKVEFVREEDCDTIHLHLPDFRRENLRVQLTTNKMLRISGQRQIENNKVIRFQKEFPVSPNYDPSKITAKFERGILYVRQPKLITPEDKQDKNSPIPEPATRQKPEDKPQPQEIVQQKSEEKTSPRDSSAKQTNGLDVPQKRPEKEQSKTTNGKGTESISSSSLKEKFEEEKSGSLDESKKQTSFTSDKSENDATEAADKTDKGTTENVEGSGKKRIENYEGAAIGMAEKLKMSRRIMNVVLVVLLAVVLGLYVANFIRSYSKAEN